MSCDGGFVDGEALRYIGVGESKWGGGRSWKDVLLCR